MSRKLYVSADISIDEAIAEISDEDPIAALLWPWLLVHLDDWGRSSASPRRLKAAIAPMMQAVTMETISKALHAFADHKLIALYEVDGQTFLAVDPEKWWRYQTHIHKSKRQNDTSAIPAPPSDAFGGNSATSRDSAELRDGSQVHCASSFLLPPSSLHPTPTTLPPVEADASAPEETAQTIVAFAVDRARDTGVALTKGVVGHLATEVGRQFKAGANPMLIRKAVAVLVDENKSPSTLSYVMRDLKGGDSRGRLAAVSGRSADGEW